MIYLTLRWTPERTTTTTTRDQSGEGAEPRASGSATTNCRCVITLKSIFIYKRLCEACAVRKRMHRCMIRTTSHREFGYEELQRMVFMGFWLLTLSAIRCLKFGIHLQCQYRVTHHIDSNLSLTTKQKYRDLQKGLYVVARILFLLLPNCSAWPCLGPAQQDLHTFLFPSVYSLVKQKLSFKEG